MKRPTMLTEALLAQASIDLGLSVERDVEVIRHRCKHEGLSFLTITLSTLSDALERGIECGRFTCPSSFRSHGSLPRFLGGFFNRVFTKTGELRQDADAQCIYYIRQICRFWKKLKIGCTSRREKAAIRQFLDVEEELRQMTSAVVRKDNYLEGIARIIWPQVFPEVDPNDLICHHGPGVTADRRLSNERHRIRYWYDRWEFTYPVDLHAYPNYEYACEGSREGSSGSGITQLGVRDEPGVRVVFVPKTQTTPRVIAIEPSSMQFVQQSLKDYIVPILESNGLTKHSVHFTDQTLNQSLAHRSSIDRRLATIDLKEASDRVHFELVRRIFKGSGIIDYLEDARSLHATLPDGTNIILNKYASMGSALCFPVEAMVFYTLIQACIHAQLSIRPTSRSVRLISKSIDIYGDDIIIPVEYTDAVMDYLESYGLKVNKHKSFRNSLFRESCGGDFYNGQSVKPIYAREVPGKDPSTWSANRVMSWVSTADQFYMNGQWYIAQVIRDMLDSDLRLKIPRSTVQSSGVSYASLLFDTNLRYNTEICGWEQRRIHFVPLKRKDQIDGDAIACLNRWGYTIRGSYDRYTSGSIGSFGSARTGRDRVTSKVGAASAANKPVCRVSDSPNATWEIHPRLRQVGPSYAQLLGQQLGPVREALDFSSSVKRGGFKSKRRWVTILS